MLFIFISLFTSVLWPPWEGRNETKTAKKRRRGKAAKLEMEKLQELANEKSHAVDQYLLSGDEKVRGNVLNTGHDWMSKCFLVAFMLLPYIQGRYSPISDCIEK